MRPGTPKNDVEARRQQEDAILRRFIVFLGSFSAPRSQNFLSGVQKAEHFDIRGAIKRCKTVAEAHSDGSITFCSFAELKKAILKFETFLQREEKFFHFGPLPIAKGTQRMSRCEREFYPNPFSKKNHKKKKKNLLRNAGRENI